MKTLYTDIEKIETFFSTEEEKETVYKLIESHIELMPKVHRKRYPNWVFVEYLTGHGSGFSASICKALGVEPSGYEWIKNEDIENYKHNIESLEE